MRRIGYFLYSEADKNLFDEYQYLKEENCDVIFFDEYEGGEADYPSFEMLFSKIKKGDIVIVRSLEHLALSIKQLAINVNRIKNNRLNLISVEQNNVNTITNEYNYVFESILTFCEFEKEFHSVKNSGERNYRRNEYRGWTKEKLDLVQKCCELYQKGLPINEIRKQLTLSRATIYKYVRLIEDGELEEIKKFVIDAKSKVKRPAGRPKRLSAKSKYVAREVKRLIKLKTSPKAIQERLNIKKGTYYRYKNLNEEELN